MGEGFICAYCSRYSPKPHHSSQSGRQEFEVAGHNSLTASREHGAYALSTLPLFHSLQNSSHEMVQPTNRMGPPTSMNVIKITLSSQAWLRDVSVTIWLILLRQGDFPHLDRGWRPEGFFNLPASPGPVLACQGCRDAYLFLQECWIWT